MCGRFEVKSPAKECGRSEGEMILIYCRSGEEGHVISMEEICLEL